MASSPVSGDPDGTPRGAGERHPERMRRRRPPGQQDPDVQPLSVRRSVVRFPFAVIELAREWLARFIAVQGFDRAMSISAYAYSALFPLLIVYASVLPRASNKDFSDVLIKE